MAVSVRELPPGMAVGPYRITERIGEGAFATVYAAELPDGTEHALKVRRAGEASHDRRFLREFESMRALRIPGVVRVHDAGQDADLLWFSMDRVRGRHFDAVVGSLPTSRARARLASRLGRQVLQTLATLHQSGIIHRDIKPSNILVDDADRVHVLDFGIVRFFGEVPGAQTTSSGEVIGTVPFMAPEQLAGLPIDERVDIYAAGVLLYEAVAGKRERPKNVLAWIPRTCLERLEPLAARFPDVSRGLSATIDKMLTVDPQQRPTAAAVARMLRHDDAGRPSREWPEPAFVPPGEWFDELLGCVGDTRHPHIHVLQGPVGAGKRRLAEQVHREGLVQGVWTVHSRCRVDRVGAPVAQLLDTLVRSLRDDDGSRNALSARADALRRRWPLVGIPSEPTDSPPPDAEAIASALASVLTGLANGRPTLWVVHAAEDVDALTARCIEAVARMTSRHLGLLVLHDPRWGGSESNELLARLRELGAGLHTVDFLEAELASRIACATAPNAPESELSRCRAQHAVERGLQALAAWRGEVFTPPATRLWPAALLDQPIPAPVLRVLSGASALGDVHLASEREEVWCASEFARTSVQARLTDRARGAASLLRAWRQVGTVPDSAHVALRLMARDTTRAFAPVARAATSAEHLGRYADAREWLFLLDSLPEPADLSAAARYTLARVRARTLLRTEATTPRMALVDAAREVAQSPGDQWDERLLRAEYVLRTGDPEAATVAALRVASNARSVAPAVAVRALLVATQSRAASGDLEAVRDQLDRAENILRRHPEPMLAVQTLSWRAEHALHTQELGLARDLSVQALKDANGFGYVRGRAFNAARLGRVLRLAGRRREAEANLRDALDDFAITGDVALHAEARLLLATLVAERGDAVAARHMLDESLRRVRTMRLERLVGTGLRVALLIATHIGDANEAAMALAALGSGDADDEAPAAIVRWWRLRGDMDRAQSVPRPEGDTYGSLSWDLQLAHMQLAMNDAEAAAHTAQRVHDIALRQGFRELALHATLVLGGAGHIDETWDERRERAAHSLSIEIYLGALEMEARRRHRVGDVHGARAAFRSLSLRSGDLGYQPGEDEARGWLRVTGG